MYALPFGYTALHLLFCRQQVLHRDFSELVPSSSREELTPEPAHLDDCHFQTKVAVLSLKSPRGRGALSPW